MVIDLQALLGKLSENWSSGPRWTCWPRNCLTSFHQLSNNVQDSICSIIKYSSKTNIRPCLGTKNLDQCNEEQWQGKQIHPINRLISYSAFEPIPDLERVLCLGEAELIFCLHHYEAQMDRKHNVLNQSTSLLLRESGLPLSWNMRIRESSWRYTDAMLVSLNAQPWMENCGGIWYVKQDDDPTVHIKL